MTALLLCLYTHSVCAYKAVISVPIADLIECPLSSISSHNVLSSYNTLPYAEEGGQHSCPRARQALFNEIVDVVATNKDEVQCRVYNMFTHTKQGANNLFWTHKKNISATENNELAIPEPYTIDYKHVSTSSDILSLIFPWYDYVTQYTYSIGTRFVRDKSYDTDTHYAIRIKDYSSDSIERSYIKKSKAVISKKRSTQESRLLYVVLLKKWANAIGLIPYVTGGASFTGEYNSDLYYIEYEKNEKCSISFWNRPRQKYVVSGLDCSGIVIRAAQIAGLPYFYEDTTTLSTYLKSLEKDQSIENGDLIWHKGHVMTISDINNNMVIESTGYRTGFGKTVEHSLSDIFRKIKTYTQLKQAYLDKTSVERIDKNHHTLKNISSLMIYKIA
jgi:hypothetical protein